MEICAQFAYENGMMTKEEFEMMKKTGGKGPGGCKNKEECQNFCDNSENQETCFNFAKENGTIPEADLKRMEEGKQKFEESMKNLSTEVYSCMESAVGAEKMAKFKSGGGMPSKDIGDKMRVCFEQNIKPREPGGPGEGGSIPPAGGGGGPGMTGPGGCASPEECQKYCESNLEACKNFQSPLPSGSGGGPGSGSMPPCEGGNCPSSPPPGSEQYRPPQPGQYPPMPQEGQQYNSPPPGSTAPGSGGAMQPGVFVPQFEPAPRIEQQPPQEFAPPPPPPSEPVPPTSSGNLNSLLGAVINPFIEFLFGN